jgi:NADH-quinone oxidoreductase subunit J
MTLMQILFLVIAAVTLVSAVMVVSSRRIIHAGLWLVLALLGVAGTFALLQSRFFAVIQVMVYIGAIATLIVITVMLTRHAMDDVGPQVNRWLWPLIVSSLVFVAISWALFTWPGMMTTSPQTASLSGENLSVFGQAMIDPNGYVIPFEVASILLLAALIGAIYVASERKDEKE